LEDDEMAEWMGMEGGRRERMAGSRIEVDLDAHTVDYVVVPRGTYLCRVAEVRCGTNQAGAERWALRLVVADGPHVGKQAAWDSLVFSRQGLPRIRLVFAALGLPASGKVQVGPEDLEGRLAKVDIHIADFSTPSGEVIRRNQVPYDGFAPPAPA
jgi:hypothetical protein